MRCRSARLRCWRRTQRSSFRAARWPTRSRCGSLTRPGDEVVVSRESHAVWHETGGSAANAGVQFREIGDKGRFSADEFIAAVKPRGHAIYPPTTLRGSREHAQPLRRHRLFAAGVRPHRRRGARARHRELSRRRTALQRGGRQPPQCRAAGRAVRPRRDLAVERARRAGRIHARGSSRTDRTRGAVPAHVRRSDAPVRPARRGRSVRAGSPHGATGR